MDDTLKNKLYKIRTMADSAKRRSGLYTDLVKVDDKKTAQSLGAVQRASAPGKKLQKVGFILFWIPEPTGVTCAVGAPMFLAGRFLDRVYNGTTVKDIGINTHESMSHIHDFKKSIL